MRQRRYLAPLPLGGGDGPPWSKGLMARALAATGLTPTRAYELALHADGDMARRGALALDLDRLAEIAPDVLGEAEAGRTMRRLRRLQALQQLDLPVVLLVGGATGTGKSTLATEAAHRLGITRVTSTDFIRQTMRAFFAKEFMPSVHYSSFEAQLALVKADEDVSEDAALLGFLDQTRNVLVGVEAAIDRALEEGWSMVLEGVHLVPGMVRPIVPTRSSCNASWRSRTRTCIAVTFSSATLPRTACARWRNTSTACRRSVSSRTFSSSGRGASTCR